MSWSTVPQVVGLIHESLFSSSATSQSRAQADAQLRSLRADAINFGDVVAEIAIQKSSGSSFSSSSFAPSSTSSSSLDSALEGKIAFAALLMLDGMITLHAWSEGRVVSDKPLVVSQLLAAMEQKPQPQQHSPSSSSSASSRKAEQRFQDLLSATLSKICAFDYLEDGPWQHFLMTAMETAVSTPAGDEDDCVGQQVTSMRRFVRHAATHGRQSTDLWLFLSNACVERWLLPAMQQYPLNSPCVMFVADVLASLASKAPVSGVTHEAYLMQPSSITVVHQVQASIGYRQLWAMEDLLLLRPLCQLRVSLLTVLLHAPKCVATHQPVVEDILQLVGQLQHSYASIVAPHPRNDALRVVLVEMLEVVQSTFESLPSALSSWVDASTLFQAFLWLLLDSDDMRKNGRGSGGGDDDDEFMEEDDDDIGQKMIETIEGDHTLLAGCGSGTPKAVATSILQLLIEHKSDTLSDMATTWLLIAEGLPLEGDPSGASFPFWGALLSALQAFAAQCSANNDTLGEQLGDLMMTQLTTKVVQVVSHANRIGAQWMQMKGLYVLGLCAEKLSNISLCQQMVQVTWSVLESESRGGAARASCVAAVALSTCMIAVTSWCDEFEAAATQLPSALMDCALWVASSGAAVGAYCGGKALYLLIELVPRYADAVWRDETRLAAAIEGLLAHCRTATQGQSLTKLLRLLVEAHFAVGDGSRCGALKCVVSAVLQKASTDANVGPTITRAIAEAIGPMCISLQTATVCHCGAEVAALTFHVCDFVQQQGPHDEGLLRCFAAALGTVAASQPAAMPRIIPAVLSLFQQATSKEGGVKSTPAAVNAASLCVAVVALSQPPTFVTASSVLRFVVEVMGKCTRAKDFGNGAPALYVAMCTAADPVGTLLHILLHRSSLSKVEWQSFGKFCGLWATTLSFSDRRTQLYTLMGWSRVVQAAQTMPDGEVLLTIPLSGADFSKLRSMHEDPPSSRTLSNASLLQLFLCALCDVSASKGFMKLSNFTNHAVFDAVMSPNRQSFVIEDAGLRGFLEQTSSESAEWLLQQWSQQLPIAGLAEGIRIARKVVSGNGK